MALFLAVSHVTDKGGTLSIHGGTNVWTKALGGVLSRDGLFGLDPRTVIVVLLATIVVLVDRHRMTTPPSLVTASRV